MQHPDQKYIDGLLNNDSYLINEIYQKCAGKIKRMVLQSQGTEADAADVFQEGLISLYNKAKLKKFELTCPLEAFLFVICRNKWVNKINKKSNIKVTNIDVSGYNIGEDYFKLAEEWVLQDERKAFLLEKLEELGEKCRKFLQLCWSQKSINEVAAVLNVSYGYARKRKSECMARFVKMVKESTEFQSFIR